MNSFRNENVTEQFKNTVSSPRIVQSIVPRPALKPEEVKEPAPVSKVHISEERDVNSSARNGNMAAVILLLVMMDKL